MSSEFSEYIRHYILHALHESGAYVDGDVHAELGQAFAQLDNRLDSIERRLAQLEKEKKPAPATVTVETEATAPPG